MDNNSGLVSIIIPVYNAERYIKEAIESVLKQTYSYFEIIVVDDASTDRTAEVVRSFNDERIRMIRHLENRGPGAARNTALEAARGRWMAVLDADDQWMPQRLEKLLQIALEAGDSFFVADDILLCFDNPSGLRPWGSEFKIQYRINFPSTIMDLKLGDFILMGSPGIKPIIPLDHVKKFSLRYEPAFFYGEDLEFWCHLFRTGLQLRLTGDAFYLYRITPGSLTDKADKLEHLTRVYERLLTYEEFSGEERELFRKQLDRIKKEEKYSVFPLALKRKMFGEALRLALVNPLLLVEFLRRLPRSMHYRLAAHKLGGKIR